MIGPRLAAAAITVCAACGPTREEAPPVDAPRYLADIAYFDRGHPLGNVVDMAVRADGTLFALDRMTHEVATFNGGGLFEGTIGREGRGPGEFRFPLAMGMVSDTLWVSDVSNRRTTLFNPEGKATRTEPLAGQDVDPQTRPLLGLGASHRFSDGTIAVHWQYLDGPPPETVPLTRNLSTGEALDTLSLLDTRHQSAHVTVRGRSSGRPLPCPSAPLGCISLGRGSGRQPPRRRAPTGRWRVG